MVFNKKYQCLKCEKTETLMWHQVKGGIQCNDCQLSEQIAAKEAVEKKKLADKPKSSNRKTTRVSRVYKTRQNPHALPKQVTPKGKGRRRILKKIPPMNLQRTQSTIRTVTSLHYKDVLYRIGDIVAIRDIVDGRRYYAQITGLMIDDFNERSASINWLIPHARIQNRDSFDPTDYVVGYKEDLPRKLEVMQFIMRAPQGNAQNNSQSMPIFGFNEYIWKKFYERVEENSAK